MARPPLTLAALATAAVPGLEISAARRHSRGAHGDFDSVEFRSTDGRHMIIRMPDSSAAEAEQSADLVALRALTTGVRGRLPFRVPSYIGQAPFGGTRAIVYDFLPGEVLSADELTADADLADSIGRAIAAVHSLPTAFAGEAGLPQSSASEIRGQTVALIGKVSDTGRLPAALLRRWETATDDSALWQFQPAVVNGALGADSFLVDGERVSAVIGWSALSVGDPARDLHWLMSARGAAAEVAFAAYTAARPGTTDALIAQRALLYGELELARWLLHGVTLRDSAIIDDAVAMLDGLVESVHAEHVSPLAPETGPILAVGEVEQMLESTPRDTAHRDAGASLLTDSYDQSDFERLDAGESGAADRDPNATGALPLDLEGFGDRDEDADASDAGPSGR